MNQSYAAILSRSASIAVKKSKEAKVLEELQNRTDLTQKEIAKKVGCCEVYVSQIKKAKMMDAQPTWYDKHMSRAKEFDPSSLALDRAIAYTSNLYPDVPLRDITEKERSEHMLNISADLKAAKNTRESLRRALFQGARKEDFHGFVEVEQTMSEEDSKAFAAILHSKLPTLLTSKKHGAAAAYEACFAPIFEYAQLAPLGPGEVRGDAEAEDDRRMGDKKRSQAKLLLCLKQLRSVSSRPKLMSTSAHARPPRRGGAALTVLLPISRRRKHSYSTFSDSCECTTTAFGRYTTSPRF